MEDSLKKRYSLADEDLKKIELQHGIGMVGPEALLEAQRIFEDIKFVSDVYGVNFSND